MSLLATSQNWQHSAELPGMDRGGQGVRETLKSSRRDLGKMPRPSETTASLPEHTICLDPLPPDFVPLDTFRGISQNACLMEV